MNKTIMMRVRKIIIFISFLFFPLVFKLLSPYVIIDGAQEGIVNGSFLLFIFLFVFSLFFGRAWCGWICPGGGLADSCGEAFCTKKAPNKKFIYIKWAIWIVWLGVIAFFAIKSGGYKEIDPWYHLAGRVSISDLFDFMIYYIVLFIIAGVPLLFGKRAMCKYICWMAPFQIIGRKISNFLRLPGLRLKSDSEKCTSCKVCNKHCIMNLDVVDMVKNNKMENAECILCGNCIAKCPKSAISYAIKSAK